MKSTDKKEKKNNVVIYIAIAVIIVLGLVWAFSGNNTLQEESPNVEDGPSVQDNVNINENIETVSDNDNVKLTKVSAPELVSLYDKVKIEPFVQYNLDSEDKVYVKVTIEEVSGSFSKTINIPYSRSEKEVSNFVEVEFKSKNDVGEHKYKVYAEVENKVIAETEVEFTVEAKYGFANELTGTIDIDDVYSNVKISGFPELGTKEKFENIATIKNENNDILYEDKYFKLSSDFEIYEDLRENSEFKLSIYDETNEMYVIEDLSLEITN